MHKPFATLEGMPVQPSGARGVRGSIRIEPRYEDGIKDLDGFSHLILINHFHRSTGYRLTVTPFLDTVARGLFATRAPRRPNPNGRSIVRLAGIDGCANAMVDRFYHAKQDAEAANVANSQFLVFMDQQMPEMDGLEATRR